jgi:hypothetical protein
MEEIAVIASSEIQKLESGLNSLQREIEDRLQRQQTIQREIEAWRTILEARSGENVVKLVHSGGTSVLHYVSAASNSSFKTDNKTDSVRKIFQEAGSNGLIASELVDRLKEAGVEGHRSFPYTAISKMKGRGEIYEGSHGRYFWKQTNLNLEVKEQEPTEVGS